MTDRRLAELSTSLDDLVRGLGATHDLAALLLVDDGIHRIRPRSADTRRSARRR